MIQELKKAEVMPCPYCLGLSSKDQSCPHVVCTYCKKEYSFCCSVSIKATAAHGCHYHRPSCAIYKPFDGADICMPDKCDMCKKHGKLCPRPLDLEDGDIPQAEYPEEYLRSKDDVAKAK